MILFALTVWLFILMALGYVIDRLWVSMSPGRWYRYVLAPGEMVHQLSHVMGCFLVGAEVNKITLYDPDGGRVAFGKPAVPLLGPAVVALAPLIGVPVGLYLVTQATGAPVKLGHELPPSFTLSLSSFLDAFGHLAAMTWRAWRDVFGTLRHDPGSLGTWIFVYLASVLTLRIGPAKPEWKTSLAGLGVLAAFFVLLALGDHYGVARTPYRLVEHLVWAAWKVLSFGAAMLVGLFGISVVAAGIFRAARASGAIEGAGGKKADAEAD